MKERKVLLLTAAIGLALTFCGAPKESTDTIPGYSMSSSVAGNVTGKISSTPVTESNPCI